MAPEQEKKMELSAFEKMSEVYKKLPGKGDQKIFKIDNVNFMVSREDNTAYGAFGRVPPPQIFYEYTVDASDASSHDLIEFKVDHRGLSEISIPINVKIGEIFISKSKTQAFKIDKNEEEGGINLINWLETVAKTKKYTKPPVEFYI